MRTEPFTRRRFLAGASCALAAGGVVTAGEHIAGSFDLSPKAPHFTPRAKSVIFLVQNGGPSPMDLFDPKPALDRYAGKTYTAKKLEKFQQGNSDNLLGMPFSFRKHGDCGMDFAEVLPRLASLADDLCMIRSMRSEHNNHTEALLLYNTGKIFQGRPALGSWVGYGLGSENRSLPGFVVLRDPEGYNTSGTLLWQNGWLPAIFRGTEISTSGAPVLNLHRAKPVPRGVETRNLDLLRSLNEAHREKFPDSDELAARIENYELASRMPSVASDVLDLSKESAATQRLYGLESSVTRGYGLRCLMARRLVEGGVRFVQVMPPKGQPWDSHSNVDTQNRDICAKTDQGSWALIRDLKERGMLDETIVVWGGEFGRLPVSQNGKGRDHNRHAFTIFIAGGGFRRGFIYGETDEVCHHVARGAVTVPDLHATILGQLGLDHRRLVFDVHGSAESLTDARVTDARVIDEVLARPARPA